MLARSFTRMSGQPTFNQKESFLKEAKELAMTFQVSFTSDHWADEHALGAQKYNAKTGKSYILPVHQLISSGPKNPRRPIDTG